MKRSIAFILAVWMLLSVVPSFGVAEGASASTLVIGADSAMNGYFFSDIWGYNSSDMEVRGLIHGYETVSLAKGGSFALNNHILDGYQSQTAGNGEKTYSFTLKDGLCWNDGTVITAADYAFAVLLLSNPQTAGLKVKTDQYHYLAGWEAYNQGTANTFAGVRLIDPHTFTLTVPSAYLPYYYELAMVAVSPAPMSVIAPGMTVRDDGAGAYLVSDGTSADAAFSTVSLSETLLGENGYAKSPKLTCGPYQLVSYDAAKQVAEFEKNPYFIGNYEGQIPEIQHVTFQVMTGEQLIAALEKGKVDIVSKLSATASIEQGMALVNQDKARSAAYTRAGLAYLALACEDATMAQFSVRQALAMCVDVNALCAETMNGNAVPVYGYYGLGQWMFTYDSAQIDTLPRYLYDPQGAANVLAEDGWIYNENGEPYTAGQDQVRCKLVDNQLIPLDFRFAIAQSAVVNKPLVSQMESAAQALGARLTLTELGFDELLEHYYRQSERDYNIFFLGNDFAKVFDPYYTYNTAEEYQGVENTSGLKDETLMALAGEMRSLSSDELDAYYQSWLAFQVRWAELLPAIPLYSNVYYDFYRSDLYNYDINNFGGWSSAILYASYTPPAAEEIVQPAAE